MVKKVELIDREKLPKYDGMALDALRVAYAVEKAETVDAVPVEMIAGKMAEQFERPCEYGKIWEMMKGGCSEGMCGNAAECWKRLIRMWMDGE